MVRDFDFRRRPSQITPQTPPVPVVRRPVPIAKPSKSKAKWFLLIVVLGIGLVGGALFLQANQPATEPGQTAETPAENNAASIASTEVQIFDGGGGEAAAMAIIPILSKNSINSAYVGKTLSMYEVTEIWYDKQYRDLAQQVATVLSDRSPKLTESKVEGVFTVQVFVGKK